MAKELKLPPTSAETAEKRLEELVAHKSIKLYQLAHQTQNIWVEYRDCRLYPDGFETISGSSSGEAMLHVERRKIVVYYSLDKELERLSN